MMNPQDEYERRLQIRRNWDMAWRNCTLYRSHRVVTIDPHKIKCVEASLEIYSVGYSSWSGHDLHTDRVFICGRPTNDWPGMLRILDKAVAERSTVTVCIVTYGGMEFIFSLQANIQVNPQVVKDLPEDVSSSKLESLRPSASYDAGPYGSKKRPFGDIDWPSDGEEVETLIEHEANALLHDVPSVPFPRYWCGTTYN